MKSDASHALRTLVAGRKQLVGARVTLEHHIRGTLKTIGIKLGVVTAAGLSEEIKMLTKECGALVKTTMQALLTAREEMLAQEKRSISIARHWLRKMSYASG